MTIYFQNQTNFISNTNIHYSYCNNSEIGTIREVFFSSQFKAERLHSIKKGDFLIDDTYTVEIGGKSKNFKQIKDIENSFVISDNL